MCELKKRNYKDRLSLLEDSTGASDFGVEKDPLKVEAWRCLCCSMVTDVLHEKLPVLHILPHQDHSYELKSLFLEQIKRGCCRRNSNLSLTSL